MTHLFFYLCVHACVWCLRYIYIYIYMCVCAEKYVSPFRFSSCVLNLRFAFIFLAFKRYYYLLPAISSHCSASFCVWLPFFNRVPLPSSVLSSLHLFHHFVVFVVVVSRIFFPLALAIRFPYIYIYMCVCVCVCVNLCLIIKISVYFSLLFVLLYFVLFLFPLIFKCNIHR